jgi:hypothetical protein
LDLLYRTSSLGSANYFKYLEKVYCVVSNQCPINICGQLWKIASKTASERRAAQVLQMFARYPERFHRSADDDGLPILDRPRVVLCGPATAAEAKVRDGSPPPNVIRR